MSILRKDPVSGGWVIVAEERAHRPQDFQVEAELFPPERGICPFCPGNEKETPPEIVANRPPDTARNAPGWKTRVVPNKYAAMRIEGYLDPKHHGVYETMNGVGAHEVIIESPSHHAPIGEFSVAKLAAVLGLYRDRIVDLHRDARFRYIQIFRNYGSQAGASLEHPHSQLIALPIAPRWVTEEMENARNYFESHGRCLFCDILTQEQSEKRRIVEENDDFVAFTPYASKFSYEMWIMPKVHAHDFQHADDRQLRALADILRRALWGLQQLLRNPPYNYILHSVPESLYEAGGRSSIPQDYHWHVEIIPRVTKLAGFEWGTGFHINPVLPERAAELLRETLRTNPAPAVMIEE